MPTLTNTLLPPALPIGIDASELVVDASQSVDQRIGSFAERHHGLVADVVAGALGITPKEIRRRRDLGRLVRVHPNVLRVNGAPVSVEQQLLAACWSTDSLAVVSHRSAAAHWGIDLPCDPVIEISVRRPHAPALDGVVVHRSMDLEDDHWTVHGGLPVTSPARTIIDLGAVVPWWLVDRALEIVSSRRLARISEVQALRERLSEHGRSGVGVAGEVLERRGLGATDSESVLESLFAQLLRDAGIEGAVYQHQVVVDGRVRILDFAFPDHLVAVELQGYERHSQWEVFTDDCVRSASLTVLGWRVLPFTWEDLTRRPGYVLRVLRSALRQST